MLSVITLTHTFCIIVSEISESSPKLPTFSENEWPPVNFLNRCQRECSLRLQWFRRLVPIIAHLLNWVAQKPYALEGAESVVTHQMNYDWQLLSTAAAMCTKSKLSRHLHIHIHSLEIFTKTLSCTCLRSVKTSNCVQTDVLKTTLLTYITYSELKA